MRSKDNHYHFWTVTIMRLVPIYFIFANSISMLLYPGGNIHDSSQLGYSLTRNFLSDLGMYSSHSGGINFYSSLFFNTAMLGFSLITISFIYAAMLFRSESLDFKISICGSACVIVGALLFCAVGLTPADLYLDEHIFVAINAPRFLTIGGLLYLVVFYRSDTKSIYLVSISAFVFLVFAYACYQFITSDSAVATLDKLITQAVIQKAVVLVMLFSMVIMSFAFSDRIRKLNL